MHNERQQAFDAMPLTPSQPMVLAGTLKPARVKKLIVRNRWVDLLLVREPGRIGVTAIKIRRIVAGNREGASLPLLRRIYLGRNGQNSLHRAIHDVSILLAEKTGRSDWIFTTSTGGNYMPAIEGPLATILSSR